MARLGIEPWPHGYIPGALPLSYLASLRESHVDCLSLPLDYLWADCTCGQIADCTSNMGHDTLDFHMQLGTLATPETPFPK